MSNYREQKGDIRPLVCNVASFTKPVGTSSLLTMDEVETLFHELTRTSRLIDQNATTKVSQVPNVVRDFVELLQNQ